jgi:hypothetical protein
MQTENNKKGEKEGTRKIKPEDVYLCIAPEGEAGEIASTI